ncbi:hypothetical protein IC580_21775 [Cupriavidus sp. ISTL7]|uniref:Type IV toxin-antitoxin system AbiEi family antitoxin n=1 Tax=Cupriavidus gilardii TaxID=82541 RepID=A0ABY4VLV7_9BURK|nr:type IV toxin-antitoxin system AbiEi family antitoxin [Cupriavidus gilardii]QQE08762.1 hypothetical protein IC580_21775 [Cupriavidus sp. ISTL7]USE78205.1 type IV toxin-antitoxin system AbiEi family antitoxin [Cupriavidus gilardii]
MTLTEVATQALEREATALRTLLRQVPVIERLELATAFPEDLGPGVVADICVEDRCHTLVCRVVTSGQPRHVRAALLELRHLAAVGGRDDATPVLIAPYLSAAARALCREHNAGYLDLEGNVHLVFGTVFIERTVTSKPLAERRDLRSLFKPKSAQMLRVMLREPGRAWRVTALAEAAGISLGHASNVRAGLLDREWAKVSRDGLSLSDPDALLDAWRDAYEPPVGKRHGFYTPLHGSALEHAVRDAMRTRTGLMTLASFSAAQWLAPYARTATQYFYADEAGLEQLRSALKLSPALKGENAVVMTLEDHGPFRDTVEPAPGVICTSPVQTYLDLANAGERGREAADHLRQHQLAWHT